MTTQARAAAAATAAELPAGGPAVREAAEPVPRWAVRVAHAIPLCVLPSGLWRVALVLGLAGYDTDCPWAVWERPYVFGPKPDSRSDRACRCAGRGRSGQSLRSDSLWTLWSGPLRSTRVARPRVGATFSSRFGLLMVRHMVRA